MPTVTDDSKLAADFRRSGPKPTADSLRQTPNGENPDLSRMPVIHQGGTQVPSARFQVLLRQGLPVQEADSTVSACVQPPSEARDEPNDG